MAAQSRGRIKGRLILIRDITRRKTAEAEKERLYTELKASMEQTRKLQGLLPICAHCKNIRDDEGYWPTMSHATAMPLSPTASARTA